MTSDTVILELSNPQLGLDALRRPAHGQPHSLMTLFRLNNEGTEAVKTPVRLGRSSVNTIEVIEGLEQGDRVILSDMSRWAGFDTIRLN